MNVRSIIQQALISIDDQTPFSYRKVSGGDINDAYYIESKLDTYFIKINDEIPPHFFLSEQKGLELLKKTNVVQTPKIYSRFEAENGAYGWLLMEWIEGEKTEETTTLLGQHLAQLHLIEGTHFGLEQDNYIGLLPQKNRLDENWIQYYSECRLLSQMTIAEQTGRMPTARRSKLEKLITHLENWLPRNCQPALLHGDFWSGNWIVGPNGIPYLIDPSTFYGHHEFELAFTQLFGHFSDKFYASYNEIFPISKEYEDRKQIYQLFYLLVHLNLFGEVYGGPIDRILERYVGS